MGSEGVDKYFKYYSDQATGGSYARFEPLRRQRGRGLGDFLAGLFRRVLPFISGGLKTLGGEVVETTVELFKDHLKGKNMAESVEERVASAGKRLGGKVATSLKGMVGLGIKRQRKRGRSQKSAGSRPQKTSSKAKRPAAKRPAAKRRTTKKKQKKRSVSKKLKTSKKGDIFGSF
jgi:hypothetical protein